MMSMDSYRQYLQARITDMNIAVLRTLMNASALRSARCPVWHLMKAREILLSDAFYLHQRAHKYPSLENNKLLQAPTHLHYVLRMSKQRIYDTGLESFNLIMRPNDFVIGFIVLSTSLIFLALLKKVFRYLSHRRRVHITVASIECANIKVRPNVHE